MNLIFLKTIKNVVYWQCHYHLGNAICPCNNLYAAKEKNELIGRKMRKERRDYREGKEGKEGKE